VLVVLAMGIALGMAMRVVVLVVGGDGLEPPTLSV
jgi:hypothetical protein